MTCILKNNPLLLTAWDLIQMCFQWKTLNSTVWHILKCRFHFSLSFSTKARTCASIVLRGANDFMCDEMERSLHDALCVVKRVLESKSVVPGGGAVEAALSIYLENYATSMVRTLFHSCWGLYFLHILLEFFR